MEIFANSLLSNNNVANDTNVVEDMHFGDFQNPFDIPYIRALFITVYLIVFCLCITGNSMVLFATVKFKRLRGSTNLLIANLAVADLFVGIFCILPTLSMFISAHWILGQVMCKLYHFFWSLSYTASVSMLTIIAIERCLAVAHPLKARRFITRRKLRIAQAIIWITCGIYSIPCLIFYDTLTIPLTDIEFCYTLEEFWSAMKEMTMLNFIGWYTIPLSIICYMYIRISIALRGTLARQPHRFVTRTFRKGNVKTTPYKLNDLLESTEQKASQTSDLPDLDDDVSCKRSGSTSCETKYCYRRSLTRGKMESGTSKTTEILNGQDQKSPNVGTPIEQFDHDHDLLTQSLSGTSNKTRHDKVLYGIRGNMKRTRSASEILNEPVESAEDKHSRNSCSSSEFPEQGDVVLCQSIGRPSYRAYYRGGDKTRRMASATEGLLLNESTEVSYSTLQSRRRYKLSRMQEKGRIIRLLVAIVIVFAVCVLPHHIRELSFYWYPWLFEKLDIISVPVSFILLYINSALNPILYALFSTKFRLCFREYIRNKWL